MGLLFVESLPGPKVFKCKFCGVDSASPDAIVSKEFRGRHGRAYLFDSVVNVSLGPREDRLLMTGLHTVNDIYCSCCQRLLGWRYEHLLAVPSCMTNLYNTSYCHMDYNTNPLSYTLGHFIQMSASEKAYSEDQKYKEGKYILEKHMMLKEGW